MDADGLIDAFVDKINHSPRRRIREEDIPLRLREGGAEFGLYYDWTIQQSDRITWIESLETYLPAKLPPTYRSLVTRFLFPAFEIDPLILLANTGQDLYHEMRIAATQDKVLSGVLLRSGYAQFARPNTGDSDPVCFDFKRRSVDGECPIVRISHHAIVSHSRAQVIEEIATSFYQLVEEYVQSDIPPVVSKT